MLWKNLNVVWMEAFTSAFRGAVHSGMGWVSWLQVLASGVHCQARNALCRWRACWCSGLRCRLYLSGCTCWGSWWCSSWCEPFPWSCFPEASHQTRSWGRPVVAHFLGRSGGTEPQSTLKATTRRVLVLVLHNNTVSSIWYAVQEVVI